MSDRMALRKYKIVFLGDQGVGKTLLITRFMYDTFEDQYAATIGIDFLSKTMYLDDKTVRLQLWDTAGQERFRLLIPLYIRDLHVAVVVYDITSKKLFDMVEKWISDVRAERGEDVVVALVGNKSDMVDKRQVLVEEGEARASLVGAKVFIETLTKAGHNVKQLFTKIGAELPDVEAKRRVQPEQESIDIHAKPEEGDGCGC